MPQRQALRGGIRWAASLWSRLRRPDDFPMLYSSGITVVALACSSAIGIIFGFIPARNAARLNPIDALARE